ncbi:hypothetical protein EJ110_NYTH49066 [Nymphaea thermarum]|nr:hypothetical protein EJ110_NYTH49066 [Nymphaea thermarum]
MVMTVSKIGNHKHQPVNAQAAGSYSCPPHEDPANPPNEEDHDKFSRKTTSHLRKDYRRSMASSASSSTGTSPSLVMAARYPYPSNTFQKQEKTVTEYVTGFKTICDELAAIGKPLSDQDKVYWLINGLGSGYESFMTSILRPPIPAYIDVVSLLESHDNMKNIHGFQLNHNAAFISQQVPAQPSYSHNYRGRA